MKNRAETTILIVLIITLSTYIILRNDKSINYSVPKLNNSNVESITTIDYNGFEFTKKDNIWYLPDGNKASETVMDRIHSTISNLKVIDLISEREDLERFGLDSSKTLTIYQDNKTILRINLGTTSKTGNYTYVKLPEYKGIYSIRGNIKEIFEGNNDDFRSKTILNILSAQSITINSDKGEKILSPEEVATMSVFLDGLQADSFNDIPREDILLSIIVEGEENHSLIVYKRGSEEGSYPGTSSDVNFPFTLPEYIVQKLVEY